MSGRLTVYSINLFLIRHSSALPIDSYPHEDGTYPTRLLPSKVLMLNFVRGDETLSVA